MLSGLRSPSSAPTLALTSASMSSRAIQATLSNSTSACSSWRSLSASWAAVILTLSAIVASPSSILGQTDDHETRGGRGPSDPAALLHHSPQRDRIPTPALSAGRDYLRVLGVGLMGHETDRPACRSMR